MNSQLSSTIQETLCSSLKTYSLKNILTNMDNIEFDKVFNDMDFDSLCKITESANKELHKHLRTYYVVINGSYGPLELSKLGYKFLKQYGDVDYETYRHSPITVISSLLLGDLAYNKRNTFYVHEIELNPYEDYSLCEDDDLRGERVYIIPSKNKFPKQIERPPTLYADLVKFANENNITLQTDFNDHTESDFSKYRDDHPYRIFD